MNKTRRDFLKTIGAGAASSLLSSKSSIQAEAASIRPVSQPNILLLLPDQHRFDWISTTREIPVRTPALESLSKRGVRFTRAFCPSPLCAPSRASLASGKEYSRCRVKNNGVDYPLDQTTFYTLLRNAGYRVLGCGKFDLHKASKTWGLEGKHLLPEWGFSDGIDNAGKWDAINSGKDVPKDPYMFYLEQRKLRETHIQDFMQRRKTGKSATFPTLLPDEAYCDNWIGQNGLDLIRGVPRGEPWFLQVNFTGPHDPWDVTRRMHALYDGVDFPPPNSNTQFDAETHTKIRRNYSEMVENIDRWTSLYIEELKKRGELENTLIVYSSDHGEMLGDHDRWGKSVPYQPSVGIPLVAAGPGVKHRVVSDALVSLMDLAATFLDYADLPIPGDMDSLSLMPLMRGEKNDHREYVLSGLNDWKLVFDGQYKLVEGFGEGALLFDLKNDPLENNNMAGKAQDIQSRMHRIIG
ncbi:MAG: sulfatase-like hydrolase/transferase [Candidatus Omnitrophica bacterium]|nr:sulfatase-like hydrolase/transferase [Candidatus Omnitrophota bacterium]